MPLPGVGPLVAVDGRSPRDVWFVVSAEDEQGPYVPGPRPMGTILHYDGKRVVGRFVPDCAYVFFGVAVGKDEVLAMGSNAWYRGVAPYTRASLSPRGKWDCIDRGYSMGLTASADGTLWMLDCDHDSCSLRASGGPSAALPSYDVSFDYKKVDGTPLPIDTLSMRGLDDGWMTSIDEDRRARLLRYNGVTWAPQATLDAGLAVVAMWVDEQAHPWILARRGGKAEDPANVVLRFDGQAIHSLPVPATFAARHVRGTSARDVWFVGAGRAVYQWDGERLRQGEAPLDVADAWSSFGGEVWIVGAGDKAMAARTAPLAEVH